MHDSKAPITQKRGGNSMRVYVSKERSDLIRLIGLFSPVPEDRASVVCRVLLWDGRIVDASYAGDAEADLETIEQSLPPQQLADLAAFVDRMLARGLDFVVKKGSDERVCVLRWRIARICYC